MTKHCRLKSADCNSRAFLHTTHIQNPTIKSPLFDRIITARHSYDPLSSNSSSQDSNVSTSKNKPSLAPLHISADSGVAHSCSPSPHTSSPSECSFAREYTLKPLNASFDDSFYNASDSDIMEKMIIEQQSAIMTASSVSPASPLQIPPGPHTSPAPSPYPSNDTIDLASSAANLQRSLCGNSRVRLRSRKRRNAICENNASLGKGLRDFLLSYVVSNLSDSMSNSLNLDPTSPPTMTDLMSENQISPVDAINEVDSCDSMGHTHEIIQ